MILVSSLTFALTVLTRPEKLWLEFEGKNGPGKGKHIVFLTGDEEYRSEEGLTQMAKILSQRHGFKCTVLFSINGKGQVDPTKKDNEPGMEALDKADLCIMLLRFRAWPDEQMSHFANYYLSGRPIIALRTSTHAFDYEPDTPEYWNPSGYKKFGWRYADWEGGFGKQVLGETWISHWGNHGSQATRAVIEPKALNHPVLIGVKNIFGTSDVYEADPPEDSQILLRGQVLSGMAPDSPPAKGRKKTHEGIDRDLNDPMMPIAWVRTPLNEKGKRNTIVTCTMGAATDLLNDDLRRLIVNGAYWTTGLGAKIKPTLKVGVVGDYHPSKFGFGGYQKGKVPADFE